MYVRTEEIRCLPALTELNSPTDVQPCSSEMMNTLSHSLFTVFKNLSRGQLIKIANL